MDEYRLSIYFVHSRNYDFNSDLYLPVLRSNMLSKHDLIFPETNDNKEVYYKDLMDNADLFVIDLTLPDAGFNMELKQALLSKKPILALAKKSIGYEEKYQKLLQSVIGYESDEEVQALIENFVSGYKGKIKHGEGDSTIFLGTLN